MRLDVFLSLARLVKRRSAAKALADGGGVLVGGVPVKAGRTVRVGDEVVLRLGERELTVRVAGVAERNLSRAEARKLYEVVAEKRREPSPVDPEFGEEIDFLSRR